ncbi:MAG: glutamine-hydrolyzing carbamoyl-phosphate synthase small subunit [Chloroflexi bacterium]|nr:glutamine-hydrolyzing carbamoyl-phosphate synthase small subunit [Chloroflexota bacterium]
MKNTEERPGGQTPALLCLEDGTVFEGVAAGAEGVVTGEVVFNTGMTGYQEILSDPSYAGQIVTLTFPLIGNYGVNEDDFQSSRVQVAGFVVREATSDASNWRSQQTLPSFLSERGVVAIAGIDTRALTRQLRSAGVMMGGIGVGVPREELLERVRSAPSYTSQDYVDECSTSSTYCWTDRPEPLNISSLGPPRADTPRVAVLDLGVKFNILRQLRSEGVEPIVFPARTSADELLSVNPDGIVLTPGPGDPSRLDYVVKTAGDLIGRRPIFGICLGHQTIAHALGGSTFKLKFGHRGSNHPIRDLETGRVYITSQNHGFAVNPDGLAAAVTQVNINDGTVEGLRHEEADVYSIQYHPEASPGPSDSSYLFRQFTERLRR